MCQDGTGRFSDAIAALEQEIEQLRAALNDLSSKLTHYRTLSPTTSGHAKRPAPSRRRPSPCLPRNGSCQDPPS